MDEKKYQVFVSSTYVDLIHARKKIIETVLSLYHFPVGMEMFSADDSEQWEIIRETIDASDYYVIIIGHKYGSVSSSGVSYTEMEYDYAKSLNIPVLAFIRNRNALTSPDEREKDFTLTEKLEKFIEKAKANKMCDFWESVDELATKVAVALPKVMRRNPRVGWVRGDQATSTEVSKELAELSTENRNLRERLRHYESQLQADKPMLKLLNINTDLSFSINSNFKRLDYFPRLSGSDIPFELNGLVQLSDLEEYNKKIPSESDVDRYNKRAFLNNSYENNSITLKPILINEGQRVATDIHIEVELPEILVALQDENEKIFKEEFKLAVPENPIEQAKKKLAAQRHIGLIRRSLADGIFFGEAIRGDHYDVFNNFHIPQLEPINASDWVSYSGNKIIMRARKLIQSLSLEFDEVVLIPVAEGSGLINFKIICEELKEPIIFSHKIEVESIS